MIEKVRSGGRGRNGLFPNSLRIISSCLKTVSSNAGSVASSVRSAGASVAASISVPADDEIRDQVLWAGFDELDLSPSTSKRVLLLGYSNGFQVLDVEDASDVLELVSKRGGPVTYLQMQPIPAKSEGSEGFRSLHPMLLIVAGDESNGYGAVQGGRLSTFIKDGSCETQQGTLVPTPTVVRFFSLKSNSIVHVLRFRSAVYIVRCNPRIVAIALAAQVYCFDAVTLENKFSVITYPIQGLNVTNVGHGPMALGSRWLAYASNNPISSNTGRLSPQNLTPSPGVSPSTSPSNGNLVARYAMESSKQLAVGIVNLSDKGYKTLSKYCQDLLPNGSNSPISSSSARKLGKNSFSAHHNETDNAGMVVVKDLLSKDVISQFRAHTSPISALCFDHTGTLLVTASIHGNNINVFRIMTNSTSNSSNSTRYDSTSSHVHLYKLYRGLTTAIIQNISFNHYSQWITIVSSRGTCHIYFISPFGGDAGFQSQISDDNGSILVPNLSLPWWPTSSSIIGHQLISPPSTVTLSVVSRIKNGNNGWLNTVSTAAVSAAGNFHVPSGAVSAVFHSSTITKNEKVNYPLEQLLVYSPSGHVIQYELHPSSLGESCDSSSRSSSNTLLQIQDEELRVNAEAVQWWDVCRRSNWPERDKPISSAVRDKCKTAEILVGMTSDCEENDTEYSASSTNSVCGKTKMYEESSWYLSKAEVRGTYGQIPIWQNSKITFYMINPPLDNWGSSDASSRGEIEIENLPAREVHIRNKDLLPVFQHFHSVQPDWHDRGLSGGRFSTSGFTEVYHDGVKLAEGVIRPSSTSNHFSETMKNRGSYPEWDNTGYYGRTEVIDGSKEIPIPTTSTIKKHDEDMETFRSGSAHDGNSVMDIPALGNFSFRSKMVIGDVSSVLDTNIHTPNSVEFPHYIQEEYCKISEVEDENSHDQTEGSTGGEDSMMNNKHDEVDNNLSDDDMFGCIFAFSSEEG